MLQLTLLSEGKHTSLSHEVPLYDIVARLPNIIVRTTLVKLNFSKNSFHGKRQEQIELDPRYLIHIFSQQIDPSISYFPIFHSNVFFYSVDFSTNLIRYTYPHMVNKFGAE